MSDIPTDKLQSDTLLKYLCDQAPGPILSFLCEWEQIEQIASVGGEISVTKRITDRVFRITTSQSPDEAAELPHSEFLLHLEFQGTRESVMGARLLTYAGGLIHKERVPILPIVWYVTDERPSHWPSEQWHQLYTEDWCVDGVGPTISWREIWLPGAFDAQDFLQKAPCELWPLASTMEGAKEASFIDTIYAAITRAPLNETLKEDLRLVAALLLTRYHKTDDILEAFHMKSITGHPLENHPVFQLFAQHVAKDMAQDMAQDMAKNMAKNMAQDMAQDMAKDMAQDMAKDIAQDMAKNMVQENLRDAVRQLAKQRFPRMKDESLVPLGSLREKELQELIGQMLHFKDARAFRQMLNRLQRSVETKS